jgi:hypothetical protein
MNTPPADRLDSLIEEVLGQPPGIPVPEGFTDRMIVALMREQSWRESLKEFLMKILIATGALMVFGLIFYFTAIKSTDLLFSWLSQNWKTFVLIFATGLFILFTDQVVLKYLFERVKDKGSLRTPSL